MNNILHPTYIIAPIIDDISYIIESGSSSYYIPLFNGLDSFDNSIDQSEI
jgi:hypothetical protein